MLTIDVTSIPSRVYNKNELLAFITEPNQEYPIPQNITEFGYKDGFFKFKLENDPNEKRDLNRYIDADDFSAISELIYTFLNEHIKHCENQADSLFDCVKNT